MDFQKLRRDAAKFLEENKQRIHDNPHSIEYILEKIDNYINTLRNEIKRLFPIDENLMMEIEQKLPRPGAGEIDKQNKFNTIKSKLVSVSNKLENELKAFQRNFSSISILGPDENALRQYKANVNKVFQSEIDFPYQDTKLQEIVGKINNQSRELYYSRDLKSMMTLYQRIRSEDTIDDFRKREEWKLHSKVDEIISTYRKYLSNYINVYQEYYQRFSNGDSAITETFMISGKEETSGFNVDEEFESTEVKQETNEMIREAEPETVSKLDEGLEEVGAVEAGVVHQEEPQFIKTVTITYNDGYTITLDIPTDSREKLKAKLAKMVF
ncbi:hypothetical protein ACIQXR_04635 [Peribacillus sp. NPDC097224]|uniref:hypothetical protein n=1 Tax=Peribacillus sp. NPDC097224 TaxID=3364399 RepID=UPI00382CD683